MSKDYKGALYYLMTETAQLNGNKVIPIAQNAIDDLEELVKRNEPMKVRIVSYTNGAFIRYECSNCNATIDDGKYCHYCGQRLDWGGYIK